jgi:hypothetical protein
MAGRTYTPLTLQQHQAIGLTLYRIKRQLQKIWLFVGNAYGKQHMRPIERIMKAIDKLRVILDDGVCREFPERDLHENAHVYYPAHTFADEPNERRDITTAQEVLEGLAPMDGQMFHEVVALLWKAYPVKIGDRARDMAHQLTYLKVQVGDLVRYHQPMRKYQQREALRTASTNGR